MIADKILFVIFMPQFSSAEAASQENLLGERTLAANFRDPNEVCFEKFAMARAPSPARDARALPRMKACASVTALSQ
jgi:hypothetical protein